MDPTKRSLPEHPATRGQKKAAAQLDLDNHSVLAHSTGLPNPEDGNEDGNGNRKGKGKGNSNHMQRQVGNLDRGGETHRGRARTRGQQAQTYAKETGREGNQKSRHNAVTLAEAGPSTPAQRPIQALGHNPLHTPASSAGTEDFAHPTSYFEGAKSLSSRSQSESPSKSSASSTKTNKLKKARSQPPVKSLVKQLTNAQLTMDTLRTCWPSITQRNPSEAQRVDGSLIPSAVSVFMKKFPRGIPGFVPRGLKSMYDGFSNSPERYREAPDETEYTVNLWKDLGDAEIQHLGMIVDEVTESADFNIKNAAHERQWAASTVAPLLAEIPRLPNLANVKYFNIEDCAIEPMEVRPVRLQPPKGEEDETLGEPLSDYARVATATMVDWTLGLALTEHEHNIIQSAYTLLYDNGRSLNQTMGFVKDVPLFCDFKIQRLYGKVASEFQIGVWAGASYMKRKLHGWDTRNPMLGICVDGYRWNLYVLYEREDYKLVRSTLDLGALNPN
ncbi:MAG: hypothetical protein Q9220_006153 [cf. Caloplaca sp. 1 TL-2023]